MARQEKHLLGKLGDKLGSPEPTRLDKGPCLSAQCARKRDSGEDSPQKLLCTQQRTRDPASNKKKARASTRDCPVVL